MHVNCDGGFDDWRRAANDFGEFMRNMVSESGCCDGAWTHHMGSGAKNGFEGFFSPRTNVYSKSDNSLVFEFMLAGYDEKGVSIGFAGDKMILKARLPEAGPDDEGNRYERRHFKLRDIDRREYDVPADRYHQDLSKAVFRNGILTVTIPAKEAAGDSGGIRINIEKEGI